MKTKDIVLIANLSSLAIVISIVESVFIPQIIPGIKLGIANIVTVISLYYFSNTIVFGIVLIRVNLAAILLGKLLSAGYFLGLAGAILSTIVIVLIYRADNSVSPVFLSIIGAIFHNIGQLAAAYLIIGYGFMYYLAYLIVFAIPTGYISGKLVVKILKIDLKVT